MTDKQVTPPKTRSNAANGTKQIWVKGVLHRALTLTASSEKRTIRTVVETRLLESFGVSTIEELEARLEQLETEQEQRVG
ncbi:MAG: hypothetical protein ACR2QF_02685 [Geminicoccaceae bacterium]